MGVEPTTPLGSIGFRDRLAASYLTLPDGEEGEIRTPTPPTGRDGLAIRCLTIGLTSPDDYKMYNLSDPPEADRVDRKWWICNFLVALI